MDARQHLTDWTDDEFDRFVADVEQAIANGRLALVAEAASSPDLGLVRADDELSPFASQLSTLVDLGMLAVENAPDEVIEDWAALEPASGPEQAVRWVRRLRDSAPEFRAEWRAHGDAGDVVVGVPQVRLVLDTARLRLLSQINLPTTVRTVTRAVAMQEADVAWLRLTMTRNELLFLAERLRETAAMMESLQTVTSGGR